MHTRTIVRLMHANTVHISILYCILCIYSTQPYMLGIHLMYICIRI